MDNLTDYTDAVGTLGGTASGLLNALKGGSSAPAPAPAPAPKTNWMLIAGIGGAVLLVLVLVISLGGRK